MKFSVSFFWKYCFAWEQRIAMKIKTSSFFCKNPIQYLIQKRTKTIFFTYHLTFEAYFQCTENVYCLDCSLLFDHYYWLFRSKSRITHIQIKCFKSFLCLYFLFNFLHLPVHRIDMNMTEKWKKVHCIGFKGFHNFIQTIIDRHIKKMFLLFEFIVQFDEFFLAEFNLIYFVHCLVHFQAIDAICTHFSYINCSIWTHDLFVEKIICLLSHRKFRLSTTVDNTKIII